MYDISCQVAALEVKYEALKYTYHNSNENIFNQSFVPVIFLVSFHALYGSIEAGAISGKGRKRRRLESKAQSIWSLTRVFGQHSIGTRMPQIFTNRLHASYLGSKR